MVSMSVALYNTSRAMLFVGIVGIEEVEKLVEEMQSFSNRKMGIVLVIQFIFLSERIELEVYD